MKSTNDSDTVIGSYRCCRCQNFSGGLLVPGYPTPCQHCQHGRCRACIVHHESGSVDQCSSYGPNDSTAFPNAFAAAPAPRASQAFEGPSAAPRASTEPRSDDLGSTLNDQDMLSMHASTSSRKSATTYDIHNTTPNMMVPLPTSAGLVRGLLLKTHAGHVPNIPMHAPVTSLHGGLSHTRIGDFSSKQRTPGRSMTLQIPGRRYTTPAESMQSPPPSATSAYFSESAVSASPPQSDFSYLQSDRSTMSLHRDDSLTGADLPPIPPVPSLEPSRRFATSGPNRPAILSEKSPKRPIHRKPKGPLAPRVVNPDDPKDFKTAQNTVAARGTRQRKLESAEWLMRYRDDTKVYIRDLEATLAERNERVEILERENQELRQALSLRPGSDRPAQYTQYPGSSSSKHGSYDDLPTASLSNPRLHRHREIVPMQVPGSLLITQGLPSLEDSLYSMSHEQSIGDNLTTEPRTARPYDHREISALQQLEANANIHDSPQQVASEHPTETDGSLFGDIPKEADDENPSAHEAPADPSTAYDLDLDRYISWSQAQDQFEMDDDEFFNDHLNFDYSNVPQDFGRRQSHHNVEEDQVSVQA